MAAADLALKAHHPRPEIWLAEPHQGRAGSVALAVRAAGFRVVLAPGDALARIPPGTPVREMYVAEAGLVAVTESADVGIASDQAVLTVHFVPRAGTSSPRVDTRAGSEVGAGQPDCGSPFLDLYLVDGDATRRLTVPLHAAVHPAPGEAAVPSPAGRLARLAQEAEKRLRHGTVDRRLVNMQARQPHVPTGLAPQQCHRQGYSFASPRLYELLQRMDPALVELTHCEFASRLCYLTWLYEDL